MRAQTFVLRYRAISGVSGLVQYLLKSMDDTDLTFNCKATLGAMS